MMTDPVATFAAVSVAYLAAHDVADHWAQTHHQALTKGAHGWTGRLACARHVTSYVATSLVAVTLVVAATGARVSLAWLAAGQAISALTHYWADRRTPLARLAELIGKGEFYRLGAPREGRNDNPTPFTGAYALDQSWHKGWLFIAALITVL